MRITGAGNPQKNAMTIFVGSTNPVKLNAARQATRNHWEELEVHGFSTVSGIEEQPLSDEETRLGAQNRARAALDQGRAAFPDTTNYISLGMEGGVFTDKSGQMWSTVWICVCDADGHLYEANGGRVSIPPIIAKQIRDGGELGPIMTKLMGEDNNKHKQVMFGVLTRNFVTRTDEYASIAQMAIGLWHGREWDAALQDAHLLG